jgi:hypothetical protein
MSDNSFATPLLPDSQKLLERVRAQLRFKHYSIRTETAYAGWIKRFIHFHGKRHPGEMGEREVQKRTTGSVGSAGRMPRRNALDWLIPSA